MSKAQRSLYHTHTNKISTQKNCYQRTHLLNKIQKIIHFSFIRTLSIISWRWEGGGGGKTSFHLREKAANGGGEVQKTLSFYKGGGERLIWEVLKKIKHETSRVGGRVHEALYTITLETNIVSSAATREALREKK